MPKVLQIGNDSLLMQSRTGLLAAAGLQVLNLSGRAEALDRIPSVPWDLAILCHTLNRADRAAIVEALRRRNPRAPILLVARRVYTPPGESSAFDSVLSPTPARMIAALRDVVQQVSKKEKQQPGPPGKETGDCCGGKRER
jgi:DNA-binding NtrC family response regulator